jgi:hypothetical protein
VQLLRKEQVMQVESLRATGLSIVKACREAGLSFPTYKNWLAKLNHKVVSVVPIPPEDVTCLRTDTGNFALEAGVFVHNCDACSGAFLNAVSSDEKLTMLSQNAPTLYTGQQVQKFDQEAPPIAIPLPDKGYTRSRVFKA